MKKFIALFFMIQSSAFAYETVCGEFFSERKGFDEKECWLEVGTRRPEVYILSNINCDFYAKGKKYCASGNVERNFKGEKEMNVLIMDEE